MESKDAQGDLRPSSLPLTGHLEIPKRRLPVGAEITESGKAHFRVWAPQTKTVAVICAASVAELQNARPVPLEREENGYFSGFIAEGKAGALYKFCLDRGCFPDPASRFQPEGPHGPSQVIDPSRFQWSDQRWNGVASRSNVIYEMHIGTFTQEGTWRAAMAQLPHLADLGLTLLELMPVAEFPGRFGWGYDGVDLFAPTHLYGSPDDFRQFVDEAHRVGLGVILDVVYNHFGPDGNYLKEFAEAYFTDRYKNEWGEAINFDGADAAPVREFFIANAGYWIDEFHLDGLRLDATQQIFDRSPENVMLLMTRQVQNAAKGRQTYIVAENEPQETRLVRSVESGGYGMDALWNDDFHHEAIVAVTGRAEAYYSDYRGTPQEFISALKYGYLFQGQRYRWQQKRRGSPALDLEPWKFVNYIQNHDQVANSLRGARLHAIAGPGQFRALTALLLLGPGSPMLFQGQEFGASQPFFYFADHNPELAKRVAKGRKEFLAQFRTIAGGACEHVLANPESEETFRRCKLDFTERHTHAEIYALHRDLLHWRKNDPVLGNPRRGGMDGAVLGAEAFVLRYFGAAGSDRLLLVNFGVDLELDPAPEPLLAPLRDRAWRVVWSTEDPTYGGCGMPPLESDGRWWLPGHAAVLLEPGIILEQVHGENHPSNQSD